MHDAASRPARAACRAALALTAAGWLALAGAETGGAEGRPLAAGRRVLLVGLDGADWQAIDPLVSGRPAAGLRATARRTAHGNPARDAAARLADPLDDDRDRATARGPPHPRLHGRRARAAARRPCRRASGGWPRCGTSSPTRAGAWRRRLVGHLARGGRQRHDRVRPRRSAARARRRADRGRAPIAPASLADDARGVRLVRATDARAGRPRGVRARSRPPSTARPWTRCATPGARLYRDPLAHLAAIVASTRSYGRIAEALVARGQPDLLLVYLEAIDSVSHRFAKDPRRGPGAIARAYEDADALVGRLAARVAPDTWVVVLSDHGFYGADAGVVEDPSELEGPASAWHRPYGIVAAAEARDLSGPAAGGRPTDAGTISPLDVAPTLLHAAGLPVSREMPGAVVPALLPAEAASRPITRVDTVERPRPSAPAAALFPDDATRERLQALGYVGAALHLPRPPQPRRDPLSPGRPRRRRARAPAGRRRAAEERGRAPVAGEGGAPRRAAPARPSTSTRARSRSPATRATRWSRRWISPRRNGCRRRRDGWSRRALGCDGRRRGPRPAPRWRASRAGTASSRASCGRRSRSIPRSCPRWRGCWTGSSPTGARRRRCPRSGRRPPAPRGLPRHRALLGLALLASGDAPGAEATLALASSLAPDGASVRVELARAQLAQGKADAALATLAPVPASAEARSLRGAAHASRRDWARAAASYQAALDAGPPTPALLNALAWARVQLGQKPEAAAAPRALARSAPGPARDPAAARRDRRPGALRWRGARATGPDSAPRRPGLAPPPGGARRRRVGARRRRSARRLRLPRLAALASQPPPRHDRHPARRPPRLLRRPAGRRRRSSTRSPRAAPASRPRSRTSRSPTPSHASILTGLTPLRHGVRDNGGYALPPGVDTLAEPAEGRRLPHRRVRVRVPARPALRPRPWLRDLRRPPALRRRPAPRRLRRAARRRHHRRRAALARRPRRQPPGAVLRLGPLLRPPRALRAARPIPRALRGATLRRRDRLRRRAARPPPAPGSRSAGSSATRSWS